MNHIVSVFIASAVLVGSAFGGPLNKSAVPSNAKWVLHLDLDALHKTKTGGFVIDNILDKKLTELKSKLQRNSAEKTTLSLSFNNTSAITIYGTRFSQHGEKEGILLIRTSADLKKDLDSLGSILSTSSEGKKITRIQESPFLLYSLNGEGYVGVDVADTVIVARTRDEVEAARQVLLGKNENLSANESFAKMASADGGFFFLGAVQGLADAPVPPNAQVLKETDGGRLVLGEKEDNIFADLLLQGKTAEAAMKIQQIFQGLAALGSLSTDKKDLSDLANSAKVTSEGQEVRVQLHFPITRALNRIEEKVKEKGQ